jgi:hypothetical protein
LTRVELPRFGHDSRRVAGECSEGEHEEGCTARVHPLLANVFAAWAQSRAQEMPDADREYTEPTQRSVAMKRRLNLWLPVPCDVGEDRLRPVDGGWMCDDCELHVRDLTNASDAEIQQSFDASGADLCALVWADAEGRVTSRRDWSLGVAALALAVVGVDAPAAAMDSSKEERGRRRPPPEPREPRRIPGRISPGPHPREAPAPGGFGTLIVQSIPWARVFVDGVDTQRNTPLRDLRVPSGTRRVGLRAENAGPIVEFNVDVYPGEAARLVRQL